MAYYDHGSAMHSKKCREKYEELKEFLLTEEMAEWRDALENIRKLEIKAEKQEKDIQEYKSFFNLLQKLTPRQFSTSDVIG